MRPTVGALFKEMIDHQLLNVSFEFKPLTIDKDEETGRYTLTIGVYALGLSDDLEDAALHKVCQVQVQVIDKDLWRDSSLAQKIKAMTRILFMHDGLERIASECGKLWDLPLILPSVK